MNSRLRDVKGSEQQISFILEHLSTDFFYASLFIALDARERRTMRSKHIIIIERVITSRQHTLESWRDWAKNVEFLAHKHRKHTESSPHRRVNSYFILLFLYFANSTASHSWNICKGWEWRRIMIFYYGSPASHSSESLFYKLYLSSSCDCKLPRFCCIRSLCVQPPWGGLGGNLRGDFLRAFSLRLSLAHAKHSHTVSIYARTASAAESLLLKNIFIHFFPFYFFLLSSLGSLLSTFLLFSPTHEKKCYVFFAFSPLCVVLATKWFVLWNSRLKSGVFSTISTRV